ncbi:MAG: transposase, partial [Anaerolineae bacterium]|nr:transposase [Anaerolineae bacterium]
AYFGVMNSRRARRFGFRLHLTTTTHGVVDAWALAPAAIHDSQALPALVEDAACQALLGDGAYHNPTAAPVLAARQVAAPPRRDRRKREPWPAELRRWVGKVRRRIETALRGLTVVFNIECPHARSLQGLVCRISTRLLAYNLCFITGALLAQQIAS